MTKLLAGRFENNDSDAGILEQFDSIVSAGVRWSIETFGVDRIEVTVKTRNRLDVYDRLAKHNGQRLALYGSELCRPISGNIVKVEQAGENLITYTARGPRWRHDDWLVRATFPTGQDTNERLEQLLTTYVDITSSDYSDIDATGKDAAEFQTTWPRGNYPSKIIDEYRKMSDADGNPWDYWCVDETFDGTSLRKFKPYFKNRNAQTVAWRVSLKDMRLPQLSRSIEELKSFARVWYGSFQTAVSTGDATGVTLIAAPANFTGFQVEAGDRVTNITDGSRGKVKSITSGSTLVLVGDGLQGGVDDRFDVGDEIYITREDAWYSETATAASAPLTRHFDHNNKLFRAEQASSYAQALVDFYGVPIQQQSFVITAPYITDANGAKRSLWDVVANGGGVLHVTDLYPAAAQTAGTLNRETIFFITALDYDHSSNQLSVRVDSTDGRLDAQLRMAGILGSEMIARGG